MTVFREGAGELGFGLMRLPRLADGNPDMALICDMVDRFLEAGLTYFDTAWVYGDSEEITAKALVRRHPRESYQLATKCMAWLRTCKTPEDAQAQFHQSLERTGASYFDNYLMHMTGGERTRAYDDLGVWDFAVRKKEEGLIRRIGFSHHGTPEELDEIISTHPQAEFVQLQVNYLDWENPLNRSRECVEVAAAHGLPITVMEPLRGGLLAEPPASVARAFEKSGAGLSPAAWGLRFAASRQGVAVVLSGMNAMRQLEENITALVGFEGLSDDGMRVIESALGEFGKFDLVPCTACNYCAKVCPRNVGISGAFQAMNAHTMFGRHVQEWINGGMGKNPPSACVKCHACEAACPQGIAIVEELERAAEIIG